MEYLAYGLALVVGVIIGIMVGIFVGMERMRKAVEEQSPGNLRIDRSEPDEPPKAFLEVAKGNNIESIAQMKFVILRVVDEDYLSRD